MVPIRFCSSEAGTPIRGLIRHVTIHTPDVAHLVPFHTLFLTSTQTGEETYFKVKKTTRMEKVFNTYATRKGVQVSALRFLLDGQRVNSDDTPTSLELEDQDQIDCMLEQQGGGPDH